MTSTFAPSNAVSRARVIAGVHARALAVVALPAMQVVVWPRSPGPGRP